MQKYKFALLLLPVLTNALIEEDVVPRMLQDCYSQQSDYHTSELSIQTNCLENYLSKLHRNNYSLPGLDQKALDWIDSLGQKIHHRLKRQAFRRGNRWRQNPNRLRVRQEIRTLSEYQREQLFEAINLLKMDTSVAPNKYDAIALLHQGTALEAAHDGPAFVGWHRYYLVLYEEALRTKRRRVTLPYWDSTLDFRMTDPTDSILFSEIFLGNGQGPVYTGPFAQWRTPTQNSLLWRDIPGPRSSLFDPTKLRNVFNKRYHREILAPTSATDEDNLERHHDGVHRWVGGRFGHMGGLETSPQDPVFFLHHCFVDYLWERFREGQQRRGINSETDYPATNISGQQPYVNMGRLEPPKTNLEGYSNSFTRTIYRYAPSPNCNNMCGGAFQGYLYCDRSQNACVSLSKNQLFNTGDWTSQRIRYWKGTTGGTQPATIETTGFQFDPPRDPAPLSLQSGPSIGPKFKEAIVDSRTLRNGRKKRSVEHVSADNNVDVNMNLRMKQSDASAFNPEKWVTTPIEIINIHDEKHLNALQLAQNNTKSRTFNITLQTDGFSYNGRHIEQVIVDEKSLFSESVASVAFKRPVLETKAYVRVYDSYGGMCQPMCLTSDYSYQECSGVIKVTNKYPLMYMDVLNVDPSTEMQPFFRFYCQN